MVRNTSPALSLRASGTLADNLVFSTWKGRPYTRRRTSPTDPRSDAQVANRALMQYLTHHWTIISDANKTTWDAHPDRPRLPRYQCFLRYNAARWSHAHGPVDAYPATDTILVPGWDYFILFQQVRQLLLEVCGVLYPDCLAYAIHRGLSPGFTVVPKNAIHIAPMPEGNLFWPDTHVTPGTTYYYRVQACTPTGYLHLYADEPSGTPLP